MSLELDIAFFHTNSWITKQCVIYIAKPPADRRDLSRLQTPAIESGLLPLATQQGRELPVQWDQSHTQSTIIIHQHPLGFSSWSTKIGTPYKYMIGMTASINGIQWLYPLSSNDSKSHDKSVNFCRKTHRQASQRAQPDAASRILDVAASPGKAE